MKFILTEKQQNIIAKSLLNEITSDEIMAETENVDLTPTDAQKEAGNYRMGHISVKGMRISIENPIGSKRYFTKENGERGFVVMNNHYGYFNVSKGKDGDAVDVFIGPNIENFERVYCIDQSKHSPHFQAHGKEKPLAPQHANDALCDYAQRLCRFFLLLYSRREKDAFGPIN